MYTPLGLVEHLHKKINTPDHGQGLTVHVLMSICVQFWFFKNMQRWSVSEWLKNSSCGIFCGGLRAVSGQRVLWEGEHSSETIHNITVILAEQHCSLTASEQHAQWEEEEWACTHWADFADLFKDTAEHTSAPKHCNLNNRCEWCRHKGRGKM